MSLPYVNKHTSLKQHVVDATRDDNIHENVWLCRNCIIAIITTILAIAKKFEQIPKFDLFLVMIK